MITCKLVLCGESVVRDAETNAVSAFNLLEEMETVGFPVSVPRLASLFLLERDSNDANPSAAEYVLTLGGRELIRSRVDVRFDGKPRTRVMVTVQGLLLPHPGELRAALELNKIEVGAWVIPVTLSANSLRDVAT